MQSSGQESGIGGCPISDAENINSRYSIDVPYRSVVEFILSAMVPKLGVVPGGVASGCKLYPPIFAVRSASPILHTDVFFSKSLDYY